MGFACLLGFQPPLLLLLIKQININNSKHINISGANYQAAKEYFIPFNDLDILVLPFYFRVPLEHVQ